MDKIRSILVAVTIILLIFPSLASAYSYDEFEVERDIKNQPKTLDDAVDEIKQLINEGKSRWYIAARVRTIADIQIDNVNDFERMLQSWKHWVPFYLAGESDEDRNFENWRDERGGADKQYDDQANWAWDNKIGQCSENSCLVYYLLKKAGAKNIRIFGQKDPEHAFVVWGMDEEAEPNDPSSWTNEVIVPDGWQHKVLRGSKAFQNKYCGNGGKGVEDNTHFKDHSVPPRCGYKSILSVHIWHPCCKKAPYAPCRENPKLACIDGYCVRCGYKGDPCCEGDMCDTDTLECKEGKCVEKCEEEEEEEEEVFPDCPPCMGSGLQLDAEGSSCTVNGENFSVRCTYLGRSHDLLQDETFVDDVSSSPSLQSEDIPDLSSAQDSLGNEQFVDKGRIYITTDDAAIKSVKARTVQVLWLYHAGDPITPDSVPSVRHVIVDGVFLYREKYYIDVYVEVFDCPKNAVINTFDELVKCAKAVVDERGGVD